jgi:hypothetical protein
MKARLSYPEDVSNKISETFNCLNHPFSPIHIRYKYIDYLVFKSATITSLVLFSQSVLFVDHALDNKTENGCERMIEIT